MTLQSKLDQISQLLAEAKEDIWMELPTNEITARMVSALIEAEAYIGDVHSFAEPLKKEYPQVFMKDVKEEDK